MTVLSVHPRQICVTRSSTYRTTRLGSAISPYVSAPMNPHSAENAMYGATIGRALLFGFIFLFAASLVAAARDTSDLTPIVTHDNLKSAGELKDGVLTVHLEIKEGSWHPDA